MRTQKAVAGACLGFAVLVLPASAQNELDMQGVLAIAKYTGACGILDSLITFQKTTKMPGGDDFVARFWAVEATRLGLTVKQLIDRCNESVAAYDKLWKAGEAVRR